MEFDEKILPLIVLAVNATCSPNSRSGVGACFETFNQRSESVERLPTQDHDCCWYQNDPFLMDRNLKAGIHGEASLDLSSAARSEGDFLGFLQPPGLRMRAFAPKSELA